MLNFKMLTTKKIFIDLKSLLRYLGVSSKGAADERRENCFLPGYGIPTDVRIPQMRRAISWRLQGAEFFLSRPVFMYGLCTNCKRSLKRARIETRWALDEEIITSVVSLTLLYF